MTEPQALLIKIIANQLFGAENCLDHPDGIDWAAVMSEARQQAVFPTVFSFAAEKKLSNHIPKEYSRLYYASTAAVVRDLYNHSRLHHLLTSHNIPYVILKGQASARYYPDPALRATGDIDFLVKKEDLHAVDALLTAGGFQKSDDAQKHEFHWSYQAAGTELELHWDLPGVPETGHDVIRAYSADMIEQGSVVTDPGSTFCVPSPFHHGLVLLLHTVSHLAGTGIGLRHLCDWLVFENSLSEEAFLELFAKPLQDIGLWTFAQVLTKIGVMYFGCGKRDWCKDAKDAVCTAFLEDILCGGNFGIKDATRRSQAKLIQNQASFQVARGHLWRNGLISIHEKAKRDHPLLWKTRILLPVGWVLVAIAYLLRVLSGKRNNVFDRQIYADAMSRQTLYSELKLFETH